MPDSRVTGMCLLGLDSAAEYVLYTTAFSCIARHLDKFFMTMLTL